MADKQTDREAVAKIIQRMATRHVSLLAAQATADKILSLIEPKVLREEEIESIWQEAIAEYDRTHSKSQNAYERDMSGLRAISQATVNRNKGE